MADRHLLINQSGPLPLSATLTTGSNGPSTLFVSGSCWTAGGAQQIGLAVMMDGVRVGEAVIWSNESNEHRAVVPCEIDEEADRLLLSQHGEGALALLDGPGPELQVREVDLLERAGSARLHG